MDNDHAIVIYNWRERKQVAAGNGGKSEIWSLGFGAGDKELVATCTKAVLFFTFEGGNLRSKRGTGFGVAPTPAAGVIPCHAFVDDVLFTGTHLGPITQWAGHVVAWSTKAHRGLVYAMAARKTKKGIITGGKDGLIMVWGFADGKLTLERSFNLRSPEVKSMHPSVKSVCEHPKTGHVLVGTRGGEIIEFGSLQQEKPNIFLKSHYEKELWGLAVHPRSQEFLTVGRDGILGVWDIKERRQTRYAKLECSADCVAYSGDCSLLAIGMQNGYLLVVDSKTFLPVAKTQFSKAGAAITVVKFSRDNNTCAVGGKDGYIKLYDVRQRFKKAKIIKKSSSAITHIDFSDDDKHIMVNNLSYELLCFDAVTGKHVPDVSSLRDVAWAT